MSKINVWTLNAAEGLLPDPNSLLSNLTYTTESSQRGDDPWVFNWDEIQGGIRKTFDDPSLTYSGSDPVMKFFWTNNNNPHNLMPDTEYFVPIAAKCIGSRFDRTGDFPDLIPVKNFYYSEWKTAFPDGGELYKVFWDMGCGPGKLSKMITKNYTGYYDILKQSGDKHILIGYSQGGLVARYLAWLDEYIFKENLIKGIITIASANFGSPLANPDNRENITDQIIAILIQILVSNESMRNALTGKLQEKINFSDVISALRYLISITPPDQEKDLFGTLVSAFKWLSGLDANDPDCKAISFIDLNIMNIEKNPVSVLASVNKKPLSRIIQGALQNGDNRADDMLSGINGFLSILTPSNIKDMVTETYKSNIMKETTAVITDNTVKDKIASYYVNSNIPTKGHDFVIPSVYEKIDSAGNNFLGNIFNGKTNHITGCKSSFQGGNLIPLRNMLRDMRTKLKNQGML